MTHMVLDCPHCRSRKITLDVVGETRLRKIGEESVDYWNLFLTCRQCTNGVVAVLENQDGNPVSPTLENRDPQDRGFILIRTFPEQTRLSAPEHVSEPIANDFEEAVDNLNSGNYTSAGIMFRRVLQRSTTALIDDPSVLRSKKTQTTRRYIGQPRNHHRGHAGLG